MTFCSTYSAQLPTDAGRTPRGWPYPLTYDGCPATDGEDAVFLVTPEGYGAGNWLHSSQQKLLHLWGVPGSGRLIRLREAVSADR